MRKFWESIYCPNYINGYNPFLLKNMNKVIKKLSYAINNRKKIVVYGVPSVDGICSVASLSLLLRYLNADVEYLIRDTSNGDKITCKDIKEDIDFLGADVLITLGMDLDSEKEINLCNDRKIDIIVLENKVTKEDKKYVYINPRQKGCQYRYKTLSLSALTFKLMQAIAIYYNMKSINKYLDIIFIGLKWSKPAENSENAVFLKEGRMFLSNTNNIGLRAIMEFNDIEEIDDNSINSIIDFMTPTGDNVGMVNNARIILELLTTNDKDRSEQITKYLHK